MLSITVLLYETGLIGLFLYILFYVFIFRDALKLKENQDFFPLIVDFRENSYSAGKIPGGFFKREGKPSEREVLISRLIDRPIRPLFPENFLNDTLLSIPKEEYVPTVEELCGEYLEKWGTE